MNFSFLSRKNRIINIIINDYSIRYLELKQADPPIPQKWGERLLPSGIISHGKIYDYDTLLNILEECVDEWKIRNRRVRFLVPESFVIIRKVTIPSEVEDDEIKGHLYLEIGTSIHLPFDDPVFDAVVLSTHEDKKEVLIFAAQEENVMEYSNLLTDAKLDPIEAEVSPLALYRLYYHLDLAKENEDLFLVQFDLNSVNICIFEGGVPFFMHHLPIEMDENQWELKLNTTGEYEISYTGVQNELFDQFEDIYKEINRFMDFYRYSLHHGKKQVSKILLNGDHPLISQIKKNIESRFEIPLETIAYKEYVESHIELPPSYYVALGLALKGGH